MCSSNPETALPYDLADVPLAPPGRLALDQDLAAALMEQLDDAEPDVLSRPLAPAAPGLDTIISRRQSTSNGRDTPDSDGFGFSEFEGLEPLVPA